MKFFIIFIYLILFIYIKTNQCNNLDEIYKCKDSQHEFPDTWDERNFQTPPRNDIFGRYKPSYQDMHYLVGYAQLKYSTDKQTCTIIFITKVNPKLGIENKDYKIIFKFGEKQQNSNIFVVTSDDSYPEGLSLSAEIVNMENEHLVELVLENEFFIWQHPKVVVSDEIYKKGQKGVIVELLGWPYEDIAEECEFLAYAGYMGVKIYSPNEHLFTFRHANNGELNQINYIFNPVSYKLHSRMGDKHQLNNMINKCRQKGIRVYAEITINHMTANGDDSYDKHLNNDCSTFGPKDGSSGSPFWTVKGLYKNNTYTRLLPVIEYPSVPYFATDFHCNEHVDYDELNTEKSNYGWYNDYVDLNTQKEYVQQRISDFFTELISIGISGFTFNAVVNIPPSDYASIFNKFKINLGNEFTEDLLIYMQVDFWDMNRKNLFICNNNSTLNNYSFTKIFEEKMKEQGLNQNDIYKIKLWNTGFLSNNEPKCNGNEWVISPDRYILGLYNHYAQNKNSDDKYIIRHNINAHKKDQIRLLSYNSTNIMIKLLYSSYSNMNNGGSGFPDGKSDCKMCINQNCRKSCNKSVPYQKAYNPLSVGYDAGNNTNWKEGTYTRIHRNIDIVNAMREWMSLKPFDNEDELFKNERLKANCNEGCLICDQQSRTLGLCINCNNEDGYYPIFNESSNEKYYKCIHNSSKNKYYLDKEKGYFKPCYKTCKTCMKEGNDTNHNCLTCENNYVFRNDSKSPYNNNCLLNIICEYPYYYGENNEYKCSKSNQCPKEANLLIKEKNKCVKDCKEDDTYKLQYNGNCLKNCPNNTYNDTFLCKQNSIDKCALSEITTEWDIFSDNEAISSIVKGYSEEFSYTNNHLSKFRNQNYDIIFYKNPNCIEELSLDMPKFDFGDCYEKVKEFYNIKEKLIISTLIKYNENNHVTSHSFYNPITGQKLDAENICKNISITVEESILTRFKENNINYELLLYFTNQNINIFNISDAFYTDICYPFDSPIKKDITLKDRLLTFYPNITLCENGCQNKGINLTDMTVNCKCKFNDIINNELIKDNIFINSLTSEIIEFISQSNLEVMKCYKYILKNFKNSFGAYISITLIFIQIILTIIYYGVDLYKIKNNIFHFSSQYLLYLSLTNKNPTNEIDRKSQRKKSESYKNNSIYKESPKLLRSSFINFNNANSSNIDLNKNMNKTLISNKSKSKGPKENMRKSFRKSNIKDNNLINKDNANRNLDVDFKKYLEISLNNLPYDDAIKRDKRKFFNYLCQLIKEKQILANICYQKDFINTRTIKLMIINFDLFLYFIINGIFYNENYVSEVYHIEKEETFFSFFGRSIYRFFYTTLVSIIIYILVDFFMINENKLKGIFRREKENQMILKNEVQILVTKIIQNNLIFIIIIFILYIFFLYYLLCFNYVYPNMQIEWIKSSITIIIIMQLISIFAIIGETILRYMSFFFKSEKLYKVSKLLNK